MVHGIHYALATLFYVNVNPALDPFLNEVDLFQS